MENPKVLDEKNDAALEEGKGLLEPFIGKIEAEVVSIRKRISSLDIFRGLTIAILVILNTTGKWWSALQLSAWSGIKLSDIVMPAFLFMLGVSISLAFKRVPNKRDATWKAVVRTLKLCMLGILFQGGYYHIGGPFVSFSVDVRSIRWCGVLQRIGLSYLIVSLCEIWNPRISPISRPDGSYAILKMYVWHWIVAGLLSGVYLLLLYGLYVPDWEFVPRSTKSQMGSALKVKCGVRGDLGPACNAAGYVDRLVLGLNHMFQTATYRFSEACNNADPLLIPNWCLAPFDPEGILSSLSAVGTSFIGLHFGHILVHMNSHSLRIKHWTLTAVGLIVVGVTLDFLGMPINKSLYTLSFVSVTAGGAGLVFVAVYVLVDVYGIWWPTIFFHWMGMNSLLGYLIVAGRVPDGILKSFYWQDPENNLVNLFEGFLYKAFFSSIQLSSLAFVLVRVILWSFVAGALHAKKIYYIL